MPSTFVQDKHNGGMWLLQSSLNVLDMTSTIGKVKFKLLRVVNTAAHELAKFSFCNNCSETWVDEPPGRVVNRSVDDASS